MRTINLTLTSEDIRIAAEIATHAKLQEAVGYLSTWNVTGYKHVSIYARDDAELLACYWSTEEERNAGARPGYVIGAVWHGDHYGFHS